MKGLTAFLISAAMICAMGGQVEARPKRVDQIPNGSVNRCANCHVNPLGGGARNSFGRMVEEGFLTDSGFLGNVIWGPELAVLDADGDGFTNGEELGDPEGTGVPIPGVEVTFPGDPESFPQLERPEGEPLPPVDFREWLSGPDRRDINADGLVDYVDYQMFFGILEAPPSDLGPDPFGVPENWWTHQNVSLPPDTWTQEGRVSRVSEALDRLYFGREYIVTPETEIRAISHWDAEGGQYDGRLLTIDEFRELEENGEVHESLTLYILPTVDRELVVTAIEFGHVNVDELPFEERSGVAHTQYLDMFEDDQGRTVLRCWWGQWDLAFDVGDQYGRPIVDFDGSVLQPEKLPQPGDRVRALVQNNVIIRLVKDPPSWLYPGQEEPNPGLHNIVDDGVRVGRVYPESRFLLRAGRVVQVSEQTDFFDNFGLSFDLEELAALLEPGTVIQVEGSQQGQMGYSAQVLEIIDNQYVEWPSRSVDRYIVESYDPEQGVVFTLEPWGMFVALGAPIIDVETGEEKLLEEVEPGTPVRLTTQQGSSGDDFPFGDMIVEMELNVQPGEGGEIFNEWESQGRLARIDEDFFGRKIVFVGGILQVDEQTQIFDRDGFLIDVEDLPAGEKIFIEAAPLADVPVVLARRIELWDYERQYEQNWEAGIFDGEIDRIEGDRILLKGDEWPLAEEAELTDDMGNPIDSAELIGEMVNVQVQETSFGSRAVAVRAMPSDQQQSQPFREEDREFFSFDPYSRRLFFAGPSARVIAPPRGQVLDRQGQMIGLEDLRQMLETDPGMQLIVTTRASQTGEIFATFVRVFNHEIRWEEQVPENAFVGPVGGFDGEFLQLIDNWQPWVAVDAELLRGDGGQVAIEQIPPGTKVRIGVADAPAGASTPFWAVVNSIVVEPRVETNPGQPSDGESGDIEGLVLGIDYGERSMTLEGPQIRLDPARTEVLGQDRSRIDPFSLEAGDLLAINFVPEWPFPRATRVLQLAPEVEIQPRPDVITGHLLALDESENLLVMEGPTLFVSTAAEIRDDTGAQIALDGIEAGDQVRLQVADTQEGPVATRVKVVGGFEGPIFGGGGLEITSTFPEPGEASVSTGTTVEVTFNEQVGGLFSDEDFDFGLFPEPLEFSDLEISRDGRTMLADVELEEDTVYQLYVASERFGLFTMNFTTGDEMPAGGILGKLNLPPDVPFDAIALEASGVFLVGGEVDLEEFDEEDFVRGAPFGQSGEYLFENLQDGTYYVFASVVLKFGVGEQLELFAFYDADGDEEPDVVAVDGAQVDMIDLTVLPPEPLMVEATSPEHGEVGIDLQTTVEISLNEPIRTDAFGLPVIEGAILPEPLSGKLQREDIEILEDGYLLALDVELEENTTYSLLIREAESEEGLALEAPQVVVFTTGDELATGRIEGSLALPDVLPADRVIRTPAVVALIPFRDFDPLNPAIGDFAVAGTLTEDGSYAFDFVPAGRYVVTGAVDVALPSYFRMPSRGLRADFGGFERMGAFGMEAPRDFVTTSFFGYSRDETGQARDDVRPDLEGVDFMLRPEDVRRTALRVVDVQPGKEALQEADQVLDLAIEFSEPLVVMRRFIELEAFIKPQPLSGPIMEDFVVEDGGKRILFRDIELEPGTAYRFTVGSARGTSGQELTEPFNLSIRTAGAEELVLGSVSGSVELSGDEISEATVFLYEPDSAGLEVLAGAYVEEDGSYLMEEVLAGEYAAYVEIQTVGGQDLLLFYDADGDGEQDLFTVGDGATEGIDFSVVVEKEEPATGADSTAAGPNAGAVISLDLNSEAGDQGESKLEVKAGEIVELAIYGSGLTDVSGVSMRVSFDTTQVAFEEGLEEGSEETHLLKSNAGAIALFLPARLQGNSAEFGGAILSPTANTAADGDGLLGILRFSTLEGYTGASLTLDRVIFNSLGGVQDTISAEKTVLIAPPIDLTSQPKGIFSFDFNSDSGDDELFHLGEVATGQEVNVEIYINEVTALTNYSVKVLYDPEQLNYVTFADGDFLASGGGTALGLPPLLTDDTVQFGSAILGPTAATAASGSGLVGTLTFSTTEAFTETDLLIVLYSTKSFGGEQNEVEASIFARISSGEIGSGTAEPKGASADFSGDGVVDFNDFFAFADAFGAAEPDPIFDLDGNGAVDFSDFFLFADAFGKPVGKLLAEGALPRKSGRLDLEAVAGEDGVVLRLRGEETALRGYGAVVEYDPEQFRLKEVRDEGSVLRADGEALLLSREARGAVSLLGSRTAGGKGTGGLLAELIFEPLAPEAVGSFRIVEGLVRREDGRLVQPRQLGSVEARWMPQVFALRENYPNPFNPSTTIRYQLPTDAGVRLEIFDVLGQKVRTLVGGERPAGFHRVVWDGRNDARAQVAAGVYFYRLEAIDARGEKQVQVRKLMLLK